MIQTQETSVQTFTLGDLTIKLPENFTVSDLSDSDIAFKSLNYMTAIALNQEEYEYIPDDFDESVIPSFQSCTSKSTVQIGNTTWLCQQAPTNGLFDTDTDADLQIIG